MVGRSGPGVREARDQVGDSLPRTRDAIPLRGEATSTKAPYGQPRSLSESMRHLVAHLRQHLVHDLGRLALDPRAYTELLKVGVVKAGGAVTAGLLIPVTALATFSIPVKAIERITAPLVSAAPDMFDVRSLGRLSRARLRDTLDAPGSIRQALDRAADVFDPGSSDQTAASSDGLPVGDPGLFNAGGTGDLVEPIGGPPGYEVDPGTVEEPASGNSGGGYASGPNDPDPGSEEVADEDGDGSGQGDDSGGASEGKWRRAG